MRLVEESLAARPELRSAEEVARAERERIPQAGALPDPTLSIGIQNDGFGEQMIGKMETSFYQVTLSQGLPWPGKRGLRADVARLGTEEAGAGRGWPAPASAPRPRCSAPTWTCSSPASGWRTPRSRSPAASGTPTSR